MNDTVEISEQAGEEFASRTEDEELLERSAQVARKTGLREVDAVDIVRRWRSTRRASNRGA